MKQKYVISFDIIFEEEDFSKQQLELIDNLIDKFYKIADNTIIKKSKITIG